MCFNYVGFVFNFLKDGTVKSTLSRKRRADRLLCSPATPPAAFSPCTVDALTDTVSCLPDGCFHVFLNWKPPAGDDESELWREKKREKEKLKKQEEATDELFITVLLAGDKAAEISPFAAPPPVDGH